MGLGLLLVCSVHPQPLTFEDDYYIAIFNKVTLMGDPNFTLVRLYKTNTELKVHNNIPKFCGYAQRIFTSLEQFRAAAPVEDPEISKDYTFHVFPIEVDQYIQRCGIPSVWGSQSFVGQKDTVLSLAGELIYFNEDGSVREVEVGAFQYTIDARGVCYHRCFARRPQLSGLRVEREIGAFLARCIDRRMMLCSSAWRKELQALLGQYAKETHENFV